MNLDITVVFTNLIGLFILMGTGFVAVKTNVVPRSATAPFSALVLKIALPCIIFSSMQRPFETKFLVDSAIVIGVTTLLFGLNMLLSYLLGKLFRVKHGSRGVWGMLVSFCNNGFMGFPIIIALFGDEGMAFAAMMCIPFNLMMYPSSAYVIRKDAGAEHIRNFNLKDAIVTPLTGALVLGIIFYLFQISIPEAIMTPINLLGNTTTPLAMFVTGMALAEIKPSSILRDKDVWTATLMRLVLLPALALGVLLLIPFNNPLVPGVIMVTLAMPAAAVVTSLAENYGGNTELAAKTIFLSTLLSAVTIPVFTMLL